MQEYDFVIKYLPGKQNVVADAVSCRPDLMLNTVFQVIVENQIQQQIKEALPQDPDFGPILETLQGATPHPPVASSLLKHYSLNPDSLLVYDHSRLCIPKGPRSSMTIMTHPSQDIKA
jgi:hypothetical protein